MPLWIIETFGHGDLTRAFWLITGMTVPFWLAMLLLPRSRLIQRLCHPLLFPFLLCGILVYMYWSAWSIGLPAVGGHDYHDIRPLIRHPLFFLSLWCKVMILNLFLGMVLFRDASSRGMRIPVELILAWAFGPLALLVYVPRVVLRTTLKRK